MSDHTDPHAEDHSRDRIEHLKLIQAAITRMAGASADVKRFGLPFLAAAVGFAIAVREPFVILLSTLLAGAFWYLDSMYLRQERWYRDLYDEVRLEPPGRRPDFRMSIDQAIRDRHPLTDAINSWATRNLYLAVIVLLVLLAIALWIAGPAPAPVR